MSQKWSSDFFAPLRLVIKPQRKSSIAVRIAFMSKGCGSLIGKNIQCLISLPMDVIPPEGFLFSADQIAGCLTGAP
ncbi:hypothetical protein ACI2JN_09745 [Ochrobactrum teleogrylli]|uniref:Uncharacterized protein n=2 Tax=Ochrobactrum TaxID=528 RepID=A0ABD5K0Q3_9HYPH|nr:MULTISPECIES: hypothetical protein [Brucella]NNU61699.1 hypothetical protein [[Ochrobactrum] soli]TNV17789.1 hypothetical protein FIC94_06330 [[Ochrobactrum] teleogrylli]